MGMGVEPTYDEQTKLGEAYADVLLDVRVLATQHKKVPRKRIVTAEYSIDNDLDVYRLSAQLSVINQNHIGSIGEVEGKIANLQDDYEKQRVEINALIDEYNKLLSIMDQAQEYYLLTDNTELSEAEELKYKVYKDALMSNGIMTRSDYDTLRNQVQNLSSKINNRKERLQSCRQQYDVYCDIVKTYGEISKLDYISGLVEEERKRQEQLRKKKRSRLILIDHKPSPYPAPIPTAAASIMIFIGFIFLNARTADTVNKQRNNQNDISVKQFACNPFGKNTVLPTERNAVPIIPTTAGFKPDITPLTALLFLNFSKHLAIIRIMIKDGSTIPSVAITAPRTPPVRIPTNVAILTASGPGVLSLRATKSTSSACVSQPCRSASYCIIAIIA
jgi:hypothetical protein